ncbi:MAG: ribose 1,5-bisphosphate isomerase [Candidatus Hydrothermarchaeaceae archaeon]
MDGVRKTAKKIESMRVRGAGNIARTAALALKTYAVTSRAKTSKEFIKGLKGAGDILISARPSAVSLPNAVRFILHRAEESSNLDLLQLKELVVATADEFIKDSKNAVKKIGEIGSGRISDGDAILTHCNSQAALSIIKTAFRQGKDIEVFATEARPRYQGHITVRELAKEGIPVTLIVDSAVRVFIKDIDKVIVGADSIAVNGAVVNKIGTAQLALIAQESRTLFFVAAESYKFHPATVLGELIEIEERDAKEVANPRDFKGVKIRNPVFDVTPPEYVDLIITERGVMPPQAALTLIKERFGWAMSL